MKTQFKLPVILLVLGSIFSLSRVSAQCWPDPSTVTYPGNHDELLSKNGVLVILGGVNPGPGTNGSMTAVGINTNAPNYILDIVGNYTGDGVNVSSGSNQVGYSIGGNMMLWNNGDVSSIYVGQYAGNASITGNDNTFVGQYSGNTDGSGRANTFIGVNAGINFTRL